MHSTHEHRALLSAPATYQDLLQALLVSRGINPADNRPGEVRPGPTKKPVSVNVVGGQWTPALQEHAEAYHASAVRKDWQRKTGSSDAAMSFWLDGE